MADYLSEDAALRAIVEGVEAETGDQFFASRRVTDDERAPAALAVET